MTIRRQYSLPNCTLILEGLSNEAAPADATDARPMLSILVNAECQFVGINKKLHGGRTFLENLVKAVSAYAQECLSGVRHPQDSRENGDRIYLEKIEGTNLHRLTWQPAEDANEQPVEIELTTVQLFDLVEAVDQFAADTRTLPDISIELKPLSRRYRKPDEPIAQRAIPATLGVLGLALTGFIAFLLPIPEVRKPEPEPQTNPTQTTPNSQPSPSGNPPTP
ncbi:MAG: DUF4335 domain-containing protein [Hydrococcus sp. C42_A2020_068]|nr:DUF4335 domain-containing protein [Hydrococcus sp. C42_A2020_068]